MKRFELTFWGFAVGLLVSAMLAWQMETTPRAMAQTPSLYSVPQMYRVTLGADQTLTAISGFAAPPNAGTIYVLAVPESDASGATWNIGSAATSSTPPITSVWLPFNAAALSKLHLYGSSGHVDVYLSP